jgi:hypothetical protein
MDAKPLIPLFAEADIPKTRVEAAVGLLASAGSCSEDFWQALRADPEFSAGDIEELRFVSQLGELTDAHLPLVRALLGRRKGGLLRHSADLFAVDWAMLLLERIDGSPIGAPRAVPGKTEAQRSENYARQLAERLPVVFATGAVVHALRRDATSANRDLVLFFAANPGFDLRGDGVDAYLNGHPGALEGITAERRDAVKARLYAVQRLFWLTDRLPDQAQTIVRLYGAGLDCSFAIASLSEKSFCKRFSAPPHLATVHARAAQHAATALAVNARFNRQYDAVGVAAIGSVPPSEGAPAARRQYVLGSASPAAGQAEAHDGATVPDWQSLFGAPEDSAWDPGRSALSPSAYLTDLLSLLEHLPLKPARDSGHPPQSALEVLRRRRPDIEDIELCQTNAEIALPYVDLVLEVLECALFPMHFTLTATERVGEAIAALQEGKIDDALRAAFAAKDRPLGAKPSVLADPEAADTRWRIIDEAYSYRLERVSDGEDQLDVWVQPSLRRTRGSADELRAMPQHIDERAYATLRTRTFPWETPFDLWTEEGRGWLAQMGVPRHRLIELFHSGNDRRAAVASEFFALSPHEKALLRPPVDTPWTRWGYAAEDGAQWRERLADPAEFLARSGLAPEQMTELLGTDYVGQHLGAAPVNVRQTLHDADDALFDRAHRFLRLQRKTGWTIGEFDQVLGALGHPAEFDDATLARAYDIRRLQDDCRRPLAEVLGWIADIDLPPGSAGARSMARALALSIDDYTTLRALTDPPADVENDLPPGEQLRSFVTRVRRLQDSGFSAADLDHLLRDRPAQASTLAPAPEQVRRVVASIAASLRDIDDDNRRPDNADEQQLLDLLRAKLRRLNGNDALIDALFKAMNNPAATSAELVQALHALHDKGLASELGAKRLSAWAQTMGRASEPSARVRLLLDEVLPCVQRIDVVSAIARHLAESLALDIDVAVRLLGVRRKVAAESSDEALSGTALEAFLELHPRTGTGTPHSDAHAQAAYHRLHVLAALIGRLHLRASELDWLLDDDGLAGALAPQQGGGNTASAFARLAALLELAAAREQIGGHAAHLLRRIAHTPADRRKALCAELAKAIGGQVQDVEALVAPIPSGPLSAETIGHFVACLTATRALGVTAAKAARWALPELTVKDATAIRDAARVRIGAERWMQAAVPLRDALREQQRHTLVACLRAQHGLADSHALYQHFLLDVDMGPDTLTSRTRLAISSVQLYVQRLLMNLEDWRIDEHAADDCRRQWQSLKNYRVWEANRKVFLYPENWIEPELRKDKTALFRALENELQQGELTSAAAERAVHTYLEGLEQIGRLEICALAADPEPDAAVLHLFGRTRSVPKTYYYRRRERNLWSAWEKLDFGIDSDHLIPVVFDHRLYLFWPEFTEQTTSELRDSAGARLTTPKAGIVPSWEYWEVRLAFSQYRPTGWSPRNLLDVRLSIDQPPVFEAGAKATQFDKDDRRLRTERSGFSFTAEIADTSVLIGCLRREPGTAPHAYTDQGGWRFTTDTRVELVAPRARPDVPHWRFGAGWHRWAIVLVPDDGEARLQVDGQTLLPKLPPHYGCGAKAPSAAPPSVRLILPQQQPRYRDGTMLKEGFVVVYQDNDRSLLITDRRPKSAGAAAFTAENLYHPAAGDFIRRLNRDGLPALWKRSEQQKERESLLFRLSGVEAHFFDARDDAAITRIFLNEHRSALDERGLKPPTDGERVDIEVLQAGVRWRVAFGASFSCRVSVDAGGELLVEQDAVQQYGRLEAPEPAAMNMPVGEVDFAANGAYAPYNWELFLHVPLLLADRLGRNQRFEEAQQWFHHIFDPTDVSDHTTPLRYWKVRPFADAARHAPPLPAPGTPPAGDATTEDAARQHQQFVAQVENWRASPFDPHAVARLRPGAYQKMVVMKYIDNLIAWGDQLFRTDTIESINEATQLYVLAAEILGRRPLDLGPAPAEAPDGPSYRQLMDGKNRYRDLWATLENQLTPSWTITVPARKAGGPELPAESLRNYFCVPRNDKLLAYWDLVGDRLFKIRHGQNIEGRQRALALFEPPIDPGLLVRAAAAGVDLASVLRDISAPLPYHRFRVVLRKALDFCADVRALGADLLAALERKDALDLEQLRLRQVSFDLQRQIGDKSIEEARQRLADLEQAKQTKEDEKEHIDEKVDWLKVALAGGGGAVPLGQAIWKSGVGDAVGARWDRTERAKRSRQERLKEFDDKNTPARQATDLRLRDVSNAAGASQTSKEAALLISQTTYMSAAATGTLPTMITGAAGVASPVALVMTGGQQMAESSKTWAKVAEIGGLIWEAGKKAIDAYQEHSRQVKETEEHKTRVEGEIKGLEKRIAAAKLGVELAQLRKKQIDKAAADAEQIETFLRGRFTGPELYGWRVAQLSTLFFQTYQLAYDLAKRAEKAMRHELGSFAESDPAFIRFGHWDSLKKGLLAGEQLQFDLRRLEKAYLDQDRRGYEITRLVSLRTLDKYRVADTFGDEVRHGELCFDLPEALFDRDYPGHYLRRIRCVRVSLDFAGRARPANVSCTLTLTANSMRLNAKCETGYARAPQGSDPRFRDEAANVQAIATSSGLDDAGLFVVDLDDERYLPFEGAGAISSWKIELPVATQPDLKELADVVLHLGYTARDGGGALKKAAIAATKAP